MSLEQIRRCAMGGLIPQGRVPQQPWAGYHACAAVPSSSGACDGAKPVS